MSASLFRSLFSSWIGLVAAILVGLCISPFVVHTLGTEVYGLWTFVIAITSQFVILDLGAKEAIVSFVARSRHEKDNKKLSEVVSSGAAFFALSGFVAFGLMLALLPFLGDLADIKPEYLAIAQIVFVLSAFDTAVEIAAGNFDATLAGSERYDVITTLNVTRFIVNAIIVWVVLGSGHGILGLALTTVATRFVQRCVSGLLAAKYNPQAAVTPKAVTRPMLLSIGKYGLWASAIHLSNRLINRMDTVIAGIFLGAHGVAVYAVPLILIDQFRMFAETGNGILTPRFSKLISAGENATAKLLLLKWSRYSFMLALGIGAPLMVFGGDFLVLWMGEGFRPSIPILLILTLPFFMTMPTMVFNYFLYASNKHRLNARILMLEAAANIVLSVLFVHEFGLTGIALGTLIPAVLFRGVVLPAAVSRLGIISLPEYVRSSFISCIPLAILQFTSLYLLKNSIDAANWGHFFASNALGLGVYLLAIWSFYLGSEEKSYIHRRILG